MSKNIDYWEQVLQAPTPAYQELFDCERKYLLDHVSAGASVLDIGCGDGRNMQTVSERTKQITGIDNDEKAVEDAGKHFAKISTIKIIKADAAKLPFDEGTFDIVTFLMILPNLDTFKETVMKEISRVLKKDGKIIFSTFSEKAFDERMKIYQQVKVPITKIEGTKLIFDKSLGANISEQFSREQIQEIAQNAGLKIVDMQEVGKIAYIGMLEKEQEI